MQVKDLPTFPETREIVISDYHTVVPLIKSSGLKAADYNFTNIFSWRKSYDFKISSLNGMIIFAGYLKDHHLIFPPIGDPSLAASTAVKSLGIMNGKKINMVSIPHDLAEEIKKISDLPVEPDRNNWEYIYRASDLAGLPGQKYHAKRNLIKQFEDSQRFEIAELDTKTCKEAMDFSDRWCEQRDCTSDEGLVREKCAIFQMLTYFEALRLHGIVIKVAGEVIGLTMGEELFPGTYVVHVEKGDNHLKGIYQFINRELAKRIAPKYEWINREQDLGIKGLRRAKLSYYPDHFVEKYRIEKL